MTNFGDIRSALHGQGERALSHALNAWNGAVEPCVIDYVVSMAIRTDTALQLTYGLTPYMHPLDNTDISGPIRFGITFGSDKKMLGTCTHELRQRWLLDWVVKPMRMWCVDAMTHDAWDRVVNLHERAIKRKYVGEFWDHPDLWSSTMQAFGRAYGEDSQYAHVVHSVCSNCPCRVTSSLVMAMNEHSATWSTGPKLSASFDMYMLIHGRDRP